MATPMTITDAKDAETLYETVAERVMALIDRGTLPTVALNRLAASIARRAPKAAIGYDMPPGNERLRTQVAKHMFEAGCELGPDDLVTTCGGQEALALCLRAVAKPGDVIAIES